MRDCSETETHHGTRLCVSGELRSVFQISEPSVLVSVEENIPHANVVVNPTVLVDESKVWQITIQLIVSSSVRRKVRSNPYLRTPPRAQDTLYGAPIVSCLMECKVASPYGSVCAVQSLLPSSSFSLFLRLLSLRFNSIRSVL